MSRVEIPDINPSIHFHEEVRVTISGGIGGSPSLGPCSVEAMRLTFSFTLLLLLLYGAYSSAMFSAVNHAELSPFVAPSDQNAPPPVLSSTPQSARHPTQKPRTCDIIQDYKSNILCLVFICDEHGGRCSSNPSGTACVQQIFRDGQLVNGHWAAWPDTDWPCGGCKCVSKRDRRKRKPDKNMFSSVDTNKMARADFERRE